MATQDAHGYAQATQRSGEPAHNDESRPQSARPRLMRISEIDQSCDSSSSLRRVLDWIRGFLARPHPQLGRHGSVCPFVPAALELDTIWMAEVAEATPSFERISSIINGYRNAFLETEPKSGAEAINKAFLVVFPSLTASGAEDAAIIDKVQSSLKRQFVEVGLMLGEFHATHEGRGLRNPDFRPLRSSLPILAIRHMVESDLPFLMRETYSPQLRSVFLRSYLFRMGGALSQVKFDEALDGLIAAHRAIASSAA
jgi:hypothetical protein